jgi:hypothetical protein
MERAVDQLKGGCHSGRIQLRITRTSLRVALVAELEAAAAVAFVVFGASGDAAVAMQDQSTGTVHSLPTIRRQGDDFGRAVGNREGAPA